jgi:hypothetical protein
MAIWVWDKVIGTGKDGDAWRASLGDVPGMVGWSAVYDPPHGEPKRCLLRIEGIESVKELLQAVEDNLTAGVDLEEMTRTEKEAQDKLLRDAKAETEKYTLQDDDALKKALIGEDWAHGHWKTQPGPAIEIDPDLDPSVTLYLRADTHTVNGLEAYQLGTSQTSTRGSVVATGSGEWNTFVSFQIVKRVSAGTETVIADYPTASTTRTVDGDGMQDASWECPYTALLTTDAIRVNGRASATIATTSRSFITAQLGATALSNETWVFYRYTGRRYDDDPNQTLAVLEHGSSTYNSRITNFSYLAGAPRSWGVILG